jgi:hypothetical protein
MQKVIENDCSTLHELTEKALWSRFSGTAVAKQAQDYLNESMLAIRKKVDFKPARAIIPVAVEGIIKKGKKQKKRKGGKKREKERKKE